MLDWCTCQESMQYTSLHHRSKSSSLPTEDPLLWYWSSFLLSAPAQGMALTRAHVMIFAKLRTKLRRSVLTRDFSDSILSSIFCKTAEQLDRKTYFVYTIQFSGGSGLIESITYCVHTHLSLRKTGPMKPPMKHHRLPQLHV